MFCVKLAQTDGRRVRIRVCGLLVLGHYYIYGYASKWMIPIPCRLPRSARRPSCKIKRNIMRWPIHAAAHTPHTPLKCVLNFNCALIPKIFSFACAKCDCECVVVSSSISICQTSGSSTESRARGLTSHSLQPSVCLKPEWFYAAHIGTNNELVHSFQARSPHGK